MKTIIPMLLFVLAGCASGVTTESRQDESVDIGAFKSFEVITPSSEGIPPGLRAARRDIEHAIALVLTEKGYRQAAPGTADFEVEYLTYVTEHYQEGKRDRYLFEGHVRLLGNAEPSIGNPIREGTLHIHLLRDGKPVFEATATEVIDLPKPMDKRIHAAVIDMLSDLPASNSH